MSAVELSHLDDAGHLQIGVTLYECAFGSMWIDSGYLMAIRIRIMQETFSTYLFIT